MSIRPLNTILEALSDSHPSGCDIESLTEAVRRRLSPWITASITSPDGHVRVLEMEPASQAWLERQLCSQDRFPAPGLDAHTAERLQRAIQQGFPDPVSLHDRVALRVNQRLRPALRLHLAHQFPQLVITTPDEMSRKAKIETIAILRLGDVHYAAA